MSYIIVWRNNHRDPFVQTNSREFKDEYSTFEEARQAAEETMTEENESEKSIWFFDYQIYEEVKK